MKALKPNKMKKANNGKAVSVESELSSTAMCRNMMGVALVFQGFSNLLRNSFHSALNIEPTASFTLRQFFYDPQLYKRVKMGIEVLCQSSSEGSIMYTTRKERSSLGQGFMVEIDVDGVKDFKKVVKALCSAGIKYYSIDELKQGKAGEVIEYPQLLSALEHCIALARDGR